jgi:hypothetical protein
VKITLSVDSDVVVYVAFKDGKLLRSLIAPEIINGTVEFDMGAFENSEITAYIWHESNFEPYCEPIEIQQEK